MAAHYVEEIVAFGHGEPYFIGGYCLGGMIAFEMARLLRARGAEVALVVLLDSYNLSTLEQKGDGVGRLSTRIEWIRFQVGNLWRLGFEDLCGYLAEKVRMAREVARDRIAGALSGVGDLFGRSSGESGSTRYSQEIGDRAAWNYVPGRYSGPVLLFKPRKNYSFMNDPASGWGPVVSNGLQVVEVPVNPHTMLLEPVVATLAEEIRSRLRIDGEAVKSA